MVLIQVTYDVPADIAAGLSTAALKRFGSVVRDRTGIIQHLKEVDVSTFADDVPQLSAAAAMMRNNPRFVIGVGASTITAFALGGLAVWAVTSKKHEQQPEVPATVAEYNRALADYLDAIQNGALAEGLLDRLIAALSTVEQEASTGSMAINITTEQAAVLASIVADYTRKLAIANSIEVGTDEEELTASTDTPIVQLRSCLEVQKRAFDRAA